jgi:hypothetical protein
MDWENPGPRVAIGDAHWPALGGAANNPSTRADADAGPTGTPWLDANGYLVLLARARAAGKPVWLRSAPPEKPETIRPESYRLAFAEAAAYGAVRPIWLAPHHASELLAGRPAWWTRLLEEAAWWKQRCAWGAWRCPAKLLIVSDFSGANEFLATETLLLAARRNLVFEPVERARLGADHLKDRVAILWLDDVPPPALLTAFVLNGGHLITRQHRISTRPAPESHERFRLQRAGKGRISLATAAWDDPWLLAQDVHLLVSRRYDPVRIFNGGSLQFHITEEPGGARKMVYLLNYTLRPSWNLVTLAVESSIRNARVHSPGQEPAAPAKIHGVDGRTEIEIPQFAIALAVELEQTRHG